jgi:hypothetical protein
MPGPAPARIFSSNTIHALRGRINFNSGNAAAGIQIGTVPAGSFVGQVTAHIITAFNAVTTNVLSVGTAAAPEGFATAAGIAAGVAGIKTALFGTLSGDTLTVDTPVVVRYSQTGGAATAGAAQILMEFYPHVT